MNILNGLQQIYVDIVNFIKDPEQMAKILGNALQIILTLILARIGIRVIKVIVHQFFEKQKQLKIKLDIPRMETLKGLIDSIVKYTIYFVAFTSIVRTLGIKVEALIATAGLGGLAIGFGAQNLVRDVITGFFILFEDQFGVGNFVQIDGVNGVVEEVALRVTKIRDFNGDLHIIPNGEIKRVTNRSTGKMRALVNISIAYEEDIDNAIEVLNRESEKIRNENNSIVEGPTVLGVADLGNSEVVLSVVAKTIPMEQWAVERIMRKAFKDAFDREGIEIPYPRRVVISKKTD